MNYMTSLFKCTKYKPKAPKRTQQTPPNGHRPTYTIQRTQQTPPAGHRPTDATQRTPLTEPKPKAIEKQRPAAPKGDESSAGLLKKLTRAWSTWNH